MEREQRTPCSAKAADEAKGNPQEIPPPRLDRPASPKAQTKYAGTPPQLAFAFGPSAACAIAFPRAKPARHASRFCDSRRTRQETKWPKLSPDTMLARAGPTPSFATNSGLSPQEAVKTAIFAPPKRWFSDSKTITTGAAFRRPSANRGRRQWVGKLADQTGASSRHSQLSSGGNSPIAAPTKLRGHAPAFLKGRWVDEKIGAGFPARYRPRPETSTNNSAKESSAVPGCENSENSFGPPTYSVDPALACGVRARVAFA